MTVKATKSVGHDVVHVSSVHPWTDNRVHYRECESLARAGFRVMLIAVESPIEGPQSEVTVRTIPRRARLWRMMASSAQVIGMAIRTRAPIVHLHDPELIPYIPVLRMLGRLVVYDAHEDLPTQLLSKPYLGRWARIALGFLARGLVQLIRFANLAVAATETIGANLPARATVLVHNYPPLRAAEAAAEARQVFDRRPAAVYVGGISTRRGAEVMVDASTQMPEGWRLSLAGSLSSDLLRKLEASAGWRRVDYVGQVPPEAARELILESRVGLLLFEDNAAHRDALPTKMFEYFAAGVPVVASDFPLWRSIIAGNACGLLVDPNSPAAVAQALRTYDESPELLAEHSQNARKLAVTALNWAPEAERLVHAYRALRIS